MNAEPLISPAAGHSQESSLELLTTEPEDDALNIIASMAAQIFHAPLVVIGLTTDRGVNFQAVFDEKRQFFSSPILLDPALFAVPELSLRRTALPPDSENSSFQNYNNVIIAPLRDSNDQQLGAICVFDHPGLLLTSTQQQLLFELSTLARREIERQQEQNTLSQMAGVIRDQASRFQKERRRAEEQIRHLAYHDSLTGLPNQRLFADRLELGLAQASRRQNSVGVLVLNIDRFQIVNESLGHHSGDILIQLVADRLKGCVRPEDTVARFGADEFAFLLAEIEQADDAGRIANSILDTFTLPYHIENHEVFITASIGASVSPSDGLDPEVLVGNAHKAMSRAKRHGGSCCQLFAPAMNRRAAARLELETSLHKAVKNEEFVLHYQPQVDLGTGAIVGAEALVRWQHPERGLIPPAEFIALAEETNLIVPLGAWILRTACAQAKKWHTLGSNELTVAVNLSLRQFQLTDLQQIIANLLEEFQVDPARLELEITESVAMDNIEQRVKQMQEIKALGVRLSLDDFGTGYSSLNYLKRLPIDQVKIDRSFVQMTTADSKDAAIATAMITLAHSLQLSVVAEGVDSKEQLSFLCEQRCNSMQGYLFSRPVTADAFNRLLSEGKRLQLPSSAMQRSIPIF